MLYPMIFEPLYKDYIWGGRMLEQFGKLLPESGNVAESWEIASHPDGDSVVANGKLAGKTLTQLTCEYGNLLTGSVNSQNAIKFPLLVKLIDACDRLSVQVHPNDEYAAINENGELGKSEMWYILSAEPGAKLVYDVKPNVTKEIFANAISNGKVNECLNYLDVKAGDFVNIPAGLLHAIGAGIVLAEVQQNSNTTYRVFDYDRTDVNGNKRELHVEKALEVIDFDTESHQGRLPGLAIDSPEHKRTFLVANEYFCVEKLDISGSLTAEEDGSKFQILIVLKGHGTLTAGETNVDLQQGMSILIPAMTKEYSLQGELQLLKAYVPDLEKDVVKPLLGSGFSLEQLKESIAGLNL